MTREESFQIYYESFKRKYKDVYSEEEIIEKVNWLLDKQEKLPKTGKSIAVYYYGFLIDVEEIERFRKDLNNFGIELGHYNKEGDIYNAFGLPDISVILNDPLVVSIAANIATELIKSMYLKIRGKKLKSINGKNENTKNVIFEVEIKVAKNKKNTFRIEGDLNDTQVNNLIDKIKEISDGAALNTSDSTGKITKTYRPDKDNTEWEEYDLLEQIKQASEMRQKAKDQPDSLS